LAYFGAKILHPTCIWPTQQQNVPVRLLNTMQPEALGTTIAQQTNTQGIKAVAAKDGITAVKIKSSRMLLAYGFLRRVFEVFEKYKTSIDMITTSEVAVSVTIDSNTYLKEITEELKAFGTVEVIANQSIISIVGNQLASQEKLLQNLFTSLNKIPITMVSFGGSNHNISLLVAQENKVQTLQQINSGLFGLN
jgi:aspartate kinase